MNALKWCITGGCGFIGTSLIRTLLAEGGHAIRVFDDLSTGTPAALALAAPFAAAPSDDLPDFDAQSLPTVLMTGDIRDAAATRKAASGADILVHLAANTGVQPSIADPHLDCEVNVIGTLNALEAARHAGVKRFIFASSGALAAGNPPPIHEEVAPRPVAPYGASKLAGEGYCSAYFRTFKLETVVLRFGNVYGPYSSHKSSVVAKFIKAALSGEHLPIYGDGSQTRDFIFIDDLVEAVRCAATVPQIGGEIFQIASNTECSINELAATMLPLLHEAGLSDARSVHAAPMPGDAQRNYSDTRKATLLLGWRPRTERREGLKRTIQWFVADAAAARAKDSQ